MEKIVPHLITVKSLLSIANPVSDPPWECGILLNKSDVSIAIAEQSFLKGPVSNDGYLDYMDHAMRIAWLVVSGWDDPIEIDVGIPSVGCLPEWPVLDGNHRLYAAAFRGDTEILVTVAGDIDYAAELFSVPAELLLEQSA